ncbi:MAG: peptide chain release factor N(5)-glutamine methyltransferase [Planctomycetes bacterium]|nr:peptide chain release factor N(5)-glutamine methyltransferase [Planctomycetota bacterium]
MTPLDQPHDPPAHTVLSVLRGAEQWLQRRGVDAPRRSAELLLGKVLGLDRLRLYLAHDRPLDGAERSAMRALVARRGAGEPVAHLLGSWSFRGLELAVSPAVLVPRPETEELVTLALERAGPGARVLDLGTGSGAIAIALAVERPDLQVTAVEVSRDALEIAAQNAARHGVAARITFLRGSWWEPVPPAARFDLAVSNPPYIDPAAPHGLAADVAAHEPPLALFTAAGDVLSCCRAIVAGLGAHLVPGGWFVAETGVGASAPALRLLQQEPALEAAELRADLGGIDRFLLARRRAAGA